MKNESSKNYIRPSKSMAPLPPDASIFTAEESKQIIDYVQNTAKKHPNRKTKTRELAVLILFRGLRPAELLNLNIGDLPCSHGRNVIVIKNIRYALLSREVYLLYDILEPKINEYFETYRKGAGPEEPLFVSRQGNRMSMPTLYAMLSRNSSWRIGARRGTYRGLAEILGIKHLRVPVFRRTLKFQLVGKDIAREEKKRLRTKAIGVTLDEFLKNYCQGGKELSEQRLASLKKSLWNANDNELIILPKHLGAWTKGRPKRYSPITLIRSWAEYRVPLPYLPILSSQDVTKQFSLNASQRPEPSEVS
jgi:hypothetical protein